MSKLRFDGVTAGLGTRSESGDRNDPLNYVVICSCEAELGPLARFVAREQKSEAQGGLVVVQNDKNATRIIDCQRCGAVTIIIGTQVAKVLTKEQAASLKAKIEQDRVSSMQRVNRK